MKEIMYKEDKAKARPLPIMMLRIGGGPQLNLDH